MTEKRFTYDNKQVAILKDGEFWLDGQIDTSCNHSEICNELNNLVKENEQLQKDCTALIHHNQEYRKENEQLKSFKNDVCDLIDELIKKAEKDVEDLRKDAYEKGYAYNPYYYWGVAHGLEKLKKELEND